MNDEEGRREFPAQPSHGRSEGRCNPLTREGLSKIGNERGEIKTAIKGRDEDSIYACKKKDEDLHYVLYHSKLSTSSQFLSLVQ